MDYFYDIITYVKSKQSAGLKAGFLLLAAFLFIIFIYNWHTSRRSLPNLYFAGQNVGNLSRDELSSVITARIESFKNDALVIRLKANDSQDIELATNIEAFGIGLDSAASIDGIFLTGKSGNFPKDLLVKLELVFSPKDVEPVYSVDYQRFSQLANNLFPEYITQPRDATISFDGQFEIVPEQRGQEIDFGLLVGDVGNRVRNLSSEPVSVRLIRSEPKVKSSEAARALEKIKLLSNQRIILAFGSDSWQISAKNLLNIVKFSPEGFTDGYSAKLSLLGSGVEIQSVRTSDMEPLELDVSLNHPSIEEFIENIAKSIDQRTVDATISFDGEKVSQFTPARDGQKLDRELTLAAISDKVSIDNPSSEKTVTINLPVVVSRAKIANEEINSLGIRGLVGRGVSYFAGSIPNRVHNLTLGSRRISGTIVKPGESFSFNKSVGEVSAATGYKQAYVISSGRTVLDDGGGICQVSTTIFRAALNAGLPIVNRTAHAYRVGYYEQNGFKAGLDATVWAPAVDLVFKNDTDHHILIQAVVDSYDGRLQVDIYGTSEGRVVELSQPVLTNLKPAPEPRYQDDPTLPRGTTKQADFAAQGATSVFGRKVYKNGKILIDEVYKSVYRPWQAVYLIGTSD